MNNNLNMMQVNGNDNNENKKKGLFAKMKEKREKKALQKEMMKMKEMPEQGNSNHFDSMGPGIKSKVTTPEEARDKKWKRKRIIRNILTIPELILIIFLAMKLKEKYIDYSNNVHQVLNYSTNVYSYEIHRDDNSIRVSKYDSSSCSAGKCEKNIGNYNIEFNNNQMLALRTFFDIKFSFKNGTGNLKGTDLSSSLEKKCLYSMIHNDQELLSGKKYTKYSEVDFNQMSSYTKKGFQLLEQNSRLNLYIAMGEKPSSGYALSIYGVYMNDGNLVFYVSDIVPDGSTDNMITHPVLRLMLEERPKSISIYDINTGDAYDNYDSE